MEAEGKGREGEDGDITLKLNKLDLLTSKHLLSAT